VGDGRRENKHPPFPQGRKRQMKIMNERNDKFNQEQHVSQQSAYANILLEMAAASILIASRYSCHHQAA